MTRLLALMGLMMVVACAPRNIEALSPDIPQAAHETLFVATQRNPDQAGQIFGERRYGDLHFGRVEVSIPPNHEPGQIEWTHGDPDPMKSFGVTAYEAFENNGEFQRDLDREITERPDETLVFVHGFNTTASEAVFRLAQIQRDFDLPDPAVLFTWPSAGDPRGYIYDRDSVLFARDDLEKTLKYLTTGRNDKVILLAHSLGSQLIMEVLRQAAIKGDQRLLSRIGGVVLMSPDIDPDVFRRQAEAIGKLPQPFIILTAGPDRALNFLSLFTGRKDRLGKITSADAVKGLDVTVIDVSAYADGSAFNHMIPVTSQKAIPVLRKIAEAMFAGDTDFARYMQPAEVVGRQR